MHRHSTLPRRLLSLGLLFLVACGGESSLAPPRPAYPQTRTTDAVEVLHGVRVEDPYRWLEDDDAADVVAWDRAQAGVLASYLSGGPAPEDLRARIEAELDLADLRSAPRIRGARRFFTHRPQGSNHRILYVTDAGRSEEPRVALDPNTWSEDGTEGLAGWYPSPDGSQLVYLRASHGSENATLYVRDLGTGLDLPDVITRTKFTSVVWRPDGAGFLYTRLPAPDDVPDGEAQHHRRLYWHRLGDLVVDDALVAGRGRPKIEWPWGGPSSDHRHAFFTWVRRDQNHDVYEVVWDGETPTVVPRVVGTDTRTSLDRRGGTYVLHSDWRAPRGALFTATAETVGDPARWTPLLPESEAVIDGFDIVGPYVVVHLSHDLVTRLQVLALDGTDLGDVPIPAESRVGRLAVQPDDTRVWFTAQAYHLPPTLYVCNVATEERTLEVVARGPTTLDADALVTTRLLYPSRDGTRIPLFVLHRKDVELDGSAPTVLSGYGGFRISLLPRFSSTSALWVERGGVWATACLRGGSEFGEAWHEAGSRENKQNVFDDFIAAADWLVETGRASRERLAILGRSNGGLLVAACTNQRPDLCRAVVCGVPLTDMLRFHRFQYAASWTREYGDPDVAEEFAWIRPYSPYHNVEAAAYPAILVTAGLHDGRVDAFHARKIVARWQAASTGGRPILLDIDRESGHGAASVRQRVESAVRTLTFLCRELACTD